jgi:hypothetical protein
MHDARKTLKQGRDFVNILPGKRFRGFHIQIVGLLEILAKRKSAGYS